MTLLEEKIAYLNAELDFLDNTPTGLGVGEITEAGRDVQRWHLLEQLNTLADPYA